MVQAQQQPTDEMLTSLEQIQRVNSNSAWMAEVESGDGDTLRQRLQEILATVPAEAARVSGPRVSNDVSHALWEMIKAKVGHDFEQPSPVSVWKKTRHQDRTEFNPLTACTDSQVQE